MTADEKTAEMIVRRARAEIDDAHLRDCPDMAVAHPEAYDSSYGCDTGCEYVRLEADLSCPHGHAQRFEYGEFGDLAMLLEEMGRT